MVFIDGGRYNSKGLSRTDGSIYLCCGMEELRLERYNAVKTKKEGCLILVAIRGRGKKKH